MDAKLVIDLCEGKAVQIRHIESGFTYSVVGHQKAKIDGKWVSGVNYVSNEDAEVYWRTYDDFGGFALIGFTL